MRATPEYIDKLEPTEIFVFGSNLRGYHGAGAAKDAVDRFGAELGNGLGLQGQSYALPTKDDNIRTLPLGTIELYIDQLYFDASHNYTHLTFLITPIGCGFAGYTPAEIAPMFEDFLALDNVTLPQSFLNILEK